MTASPPIMPDKQVQDKDSLDGQEPRSVAQPSLSLRDARRVRFYSWLIHTIAHVIYYTLRLHKENVESLAPYGEGKTKGAILVTWHGRTLLCANEFRNRGYWALISLSRDGEVQNRVFQRFGFQTVRGSTGRGGVKGLLQMARKVKAGGVIAFTPDGPRGPSHKVQLGVVLMAEKSGAPIIPVATSASRRWLIRSWDQYMVPQPFARAYFIVGEPIYVPPNLDEAGREAIALQVEVALNLLEREAEARAGHTDYPAEWLIQPTPGE
jgi:lysophospholipid acyltransferase (LPLAT)-like uncharacterized protein